MFSLSFDDYLTRYNSDARFAIPRESFSNFCSKALSFIDFATLGRFDSDSFGEKGVECVVAIAEIMYRAWSSYGVESEKNDGFSVTYSGDFRGACYSVLELYLGSSGLLYRGIG